MQSLGLEIVKLQDYLSKALVIWFVINVVRNNLE